MATNQTRNWLGALVQRGVRLALVVPVLLSVSVANAWAANWINPSVTISHVADGSCVAGPFANDTSTSVSVNWTAFNTDASPGANIILVKWRESSSATSNGAFLTGLPIGQLPTQTTADTVRSSYLIGNLMYFGLRDNWDSGSVWSTSRSPALSPDLTAPATGVSGYTAIDMTTDPDCVAIPEINVTGNGITIVDGDTSASVTDGSNFGSVAHVSGTVSRTFTIENTGTGTLTLGANAATLSGTHAADFTVTSQPATTVAASGSTSVTVLFDPSALGTRNATLSIANNDSNENPYDFALRGTGVGAPEINVTGNGQNIADGDTTPQTADHTDFGSIDIGNGDIERTFTVQNIGDANLTLGSSAVSITGPDAADFSVFTHPFSIIADGSSATTRIRFDPSTVGTKSATVTIPNDDADESPYSFAISGTATSAPEIEVRLDNGILVPNGSSHVGYRVDNLSFNQAFGERTYTINNVGSDTLAISNVTITGTHAAEFSVVTPPAATVAPAGSTTFTLRFTQTTSGVRNATINIVNNDADEGAFSFGTSGLRFAGPDLDISGQGLDIANGDTTPRPEDDTDFGSVNTASGFVEKSFTGANTGDSPIVISSITVTGPHASDFSVTTGTGFSPITVRFDPSADGLRTATVNIASDALVDNPFTFAIQGTGTSAAPEIGVSSSESGVVADGGTDAQGSEVAGSAKTVTYTVSNTGTDDLTLATATSSSLTNVTVNAISAPGVTTLPAGNNVTFTVQYTPTLAGAFSFDLAFTNNDGDENPFNMTVSGTATGTPEIAVSSSESGAVADSGTDAQGSEAAGSAKTVTYTVSNTGTDDLTLATATSSSLSNVSVNAISAPGATTVTPGNSTTFTVQYTPTIAGAFSFDLAFTNNDGNENPYNISLSGTATGTPEIAVSSSESGAVADGGADAQGNEPAGTAKTVTYTVNNTGTDDLTLATATSSSLSNVTVNAISAPGVTTVTPGNSTTFTVQYTPTLEGVFSFDLAFTNNDGDENPYNMTISGTATGVPEIAVSSSESGAVADGGTDAQGNESAGSAKTVTYTVSNTGTDDLTLATATSSSLSNVSVNAISAPGATTVTPGNSTTFTVQYTPTLEGVFSFDLAFTNNDGDENPFNMTVSGTGTGTPEIAVSSSEGGAVADSGTDAQGAEVAGSAKTVTYTVSNTGVDDLTLATATSSSLSNVTVNAISAPGSTTVTPGSSTTFTVQYTPTLAGAFSFDLSFTNNDGNENPYNISLSGTATGTPEIAVSSSESGAVADGGTDAQGNEPAGTAKTVTYTVNNTGTDDLTLATATSSSLSNVTVNAISAPGVTTVTPGNSTTFTVQYTPTLAGAFSFDLSFTNNDGDENPFNITVSGTGTGSPEVAVSSSEGGSVADGGTDAQGSEAAGSAKTLTYTVSNTGTDDLTLATATSSSLSNVTVNAISAPASTTVTPGNSTTFTVQYTPTLEGVFSFDLAFTNNDGDENPYNVSVSGTATGAPEINITGNGQNISDGDGSATATDHTDFGSADITSGTVSRTFTIQNQGLGALTLGANAASLSGAHAGDFSVTSQPATSVAASGSTSVTVQFDPSTLGTRSATLSIASDDANEAVYDFALSGTGAGVPEIAVSSSESGAVADGGMDAQGSEVAGVVKTVTYTITNSGTDDLTLAQATSLSLSNVVLNSISAPGSTTVTSGGGTTTFTVQYTPTIARAFSFALAFTNNDGDESPYNFTVSGTGAGAPEITVLGNGRGIADGDTIPASADHTDFASNDITSGAVSRTFTIQNTGTDVLNLGANAASLSGTHASDFTVSAQPATSLAPGGSTSVTVQFDPSNLGIRTAVLTIANDDADENPYDFALAGQGISGGTLTIVQNITGDDVSVGFSSATPALNFSLTSVSGTAQTSLTGVPAGTHMLVAEDLSAIGYGVSSIACNDTDSTGDVVSRTATINLTSGEHVTCVFETIDTRGPTTQMIADFLGARNTLLLSNQPGSDRRINRLKGGTGVAGGDSFQAFGHNLRSPLPVDVSVNDDSFSFATSLMRVMAMGGEASLAANDNQNEGEDPLPLDIWIEGSASRFIDGTSGGGSFGLLSFGVDYLVEPDLLIGFMGQLDRFKQDFTTPGSEIDGRGWLAGPYATLKLDEHLYLDVLGAWGRSDNDISPFGTYTDSFETDRWLISSSLTGKFDMGNWDLRPSYSLQFLHERQFAYTDSLGVRIPEQSLSQGDMRLGPLVAYTHTFEDGSQLRPKGGFAGIYSFGERNTFSAGSFAAETQGLTGQVNAGLDYQTPGGLNLGLTTDYGGIGGTAKSFGLSIKLAMPLN